MSAALRRCMNNGLHARASVANFIGVSKNSVCGWFRDETSLPASRMSSVYDALAAFCEKAYKIRRYGVSFRYRKWGNDEHRVAVALDDRAVPHDKIAGLLGRDEKTVTKNLRDPKPLKEPVATPKAKGFVAPKNMVWPGAMIDREISRIKSRKASFSDILRVDAAIWAARYDAATFEQALKNKGREL